mmetsp:Transcript_58754/g.137150  ORF Transcript_58754/g.137150 Transcript_58754/m.137150 type:complete len:649 (+) Transcript_58754:104-2050(+)
MEAKSGVTVYPGYRKDFEQVINGLSCDRLNIDDLRLPVVEEGIWTADAEETSDEETRPSSIPSSPEAVETAHEEKQIEPQVVLTCAARQELDEAFHMDLNIPMRAAMQANLQMLARRLKGQDVPPDGAMRMDIAVRPPAGNAKLEPAAISGVAVEATSPLSPPLECPDAAWQAVSTAASSASLHEPYSARTTRPIEVSHSAPEGPAMTPIIKPVVLPVQPAPTQLQPFQAPLPRHLPPQEEQRRVGGSPRLGKEDQQKLHSNSAAQSSNSTASRMRPARAGQRDITLAHREVQALQAEIAMQEVQLRGLLRASEAEAISDEEAFRANRLLHDLEGIRSVIATLQDHLAQGAEPKVGLGGQEGLEGIFSAIAELRDHMSSSRNGSTSARATGSGPRKHRHSDYGGRLKPAPGGDATPEVDAARSQQATFRGLMRGSGTGGGPAGKRSSLKPGDRQVHTAPSTPGGDRFNRPSAPLRGTVVQGGSSVTCLAQPSDEPAVEQRPTAQSPRRARVCSPSRPESARTSASNPRPMSATSRQRPVVTEPGAPISARDGGARSPGRRDTGKARVGATSPKRGPRGCSPAGIAPSSHLHFQPYAMQTGEGVSRSAVSEAGGRVQSARQVPPKRYVLDASVQPPIVSSNGMAWVIPP